MQSGLGKADKWIIEFNTKNPGINPLMGWESSTDTLSELKLEFATKELAIEYANKNKIDAYNSNGCHQGRLQPLWFNGYTGY